MKKNLNWLCYLTLRKTSNRDAERGSSIENDKCVLCWRKQQPQELQIFTKTTIAIIKLQSRTLTKSQPVSHKVITFLSYNSVAKSFR